ncbi:MAG: hypothetical protein UZ20_WS6002000621 [candidate division WS6 bacterium OLB21]|uniref:Uncharacterized protein n=1 Tax=candidate division WS6 bacterium OLB21 TaxID=1617427 RepID=A0A136KJ70_9BACT|nr:MAG: hypothetical protein UZ20_WS6002000621 [candidate division WS6 bacterium OLB21]
MLTLKGLLNYFCRNILNSRTKKIVHLKNNPPAKHLTHIGEVSYELSKVIQDSEFYPDILQIAKQIKVKPIVVYFLISCYLNAGDENFKKISAMQLPPRGIQTVYKTETKTLEPGIYLKLDEFTSREEVLHAYEVSKRYNADVFGLKNKGKKRKDYGGKDFDLKANMYKKLNDYLEDFIDTNREIPAVKSAVKLFAEDEEREAKDVERIYNKMQEDFDLPGFKTYKQIERFLNSQDK